MPKKCIDFAELPLVVLHEIVCRAEFTSKVQCEQVCKSWRNILAVPSELVGDHGVTCKRIWGEELSLVLHMPNKHNVARVMEVKGLPDSRDEVSFSDIESPLPQREGNFVQWLTKRAPGFRFVFLNLIKPGAAWLFAHLVLALSGDDPQSRHAPAMFINDGCLSCLSLCLYCANNKSLQQCVWLTGNI